MSTTPADTADTPDIQHTRWRIDSGRSSVEFHVRHFYGLQTVKGRFERYEGTLDLAAEPSIELRIDGDSLSTNNARRDEHLRSADFFDSSSHPEVRFTSEHATLDGERLRVRGELHAAGKSTPRVPSHAELAVIGEGLGMLRGPSKLIVRGRLVSDDR